MSSRKGYVLDGVKFQRRMMMNFHNNTSLAKAVGLSETSISSLKHGRHGAKPSTLKALCEELNCGPEDIIKEVG